MALRKLLSPIQLSFIDDRHRFKVACAGRRSGKSYAIAAYMIIECLLKPNTPCLYLGLTRDSSKEAVWPILLAMLEGLNITHENRPSALMIRFPNGSSITLFGGDTPNARNRLRGRKFKLICADETGFYTGLDPLIHALLPMLADLEGTLVMASSPGETLSGLFYDAYMGEKKHDWRQWHWTMRDNPWFQKPATNPLYKNRAEEELAFILRQQFNGDATHPAYQREYEGIYKKDDSALIYPYTEKNLIDAPQPLPKAQYAIGIDLGVSSESAIAVLKYSEYSREAQIVETWSEPRVLVDDLAQLIEYYMKKYNTSLVVADTGGLGAAFAQEFRRRYHLPVKSAEKMDKSGYQRIFSNDLISGYIKIVKGLNILKEFDTLVRDDDGSEKKGQKNHEADAALYVYRYIYNLHLKHFVVPETDEAKMERQLEESAKAEDSLNREEANEFGEDYGM